MKQILKPIALIIIFSLFATFSTGCLKKSEEAVLDDTKVDVIEKAPAPAAVETPSDEVEAGKEIELIEGTPAEKVEEYTEKAAEAQEKLKKLLEKEESDDLSFIDILFPAAYAQGETLPELLAQPPDVEILDEEVDTNLDTTDEGDEDIPADAMINFMPEVPEIEMLEDNIDLSTDEVVEDADGTDEQIAELIAEIQTYTELAIDAATEETDPEEVADLLEDIQDVQVSTEEIIDEAVAEADKEIAEVLEEASEEIAEITEEIGTAVDEVADAIESGAETVEIEVETTTSDFTFEGETTINLKNFRNPAKRAERKYNHFEHKLEEMKERFAENGTSDEVAEEIIGKMEERLATMEDHRDAIETDAAALREAIESGDKEAVKAAREEIKNSAKEAREEWRGRREERILIKIETLPEEDQESAMAKFEERKVEREERHEERVEKCTEVKEDRKVLHEAIKAGDDEAIEAARSDIQVRREENKVEREERFEEFKVKRDEAFETRISNFSEEEQEEARAKREERIEKVEVKLEEVREQVEVRREENIETRESIKELGTQLREATTDEEKIEIRSDIKENIGEIRENRQEILQNRPRPPARR